jgi:hypothetical protein
MVRSQPAFRAAPQRFTAPQRSAPQRFSAPQRSAPQRFSAPQRTAPSFAGRNAGPRIINVPRSSRAIERRNFRGAPSGIANRSARPSSGDNIRAGRAGRIETNRTLRNRANSQRNNAAPAAARGGNPAARGTNAPASAGAQRRAPTSPVLRNAAFANRAVTRRGGRNAGFAATAFRGRFVAAAPSHRRSPWWHRGRVIGWVGPLFWPYAYYDAFDYAFYPYAEDTFWPYAYDDVYDGIFGSYAYVSPSDAGRRPRGTPSARVRTSGGKPAAMAQICTQQSPGLTDFPIERIAETVQPNDAQKPLLDKLKDATAKAVDILQSACPTDLPSTPTGRMDALEKRLEAMIAAVDTVRVPLQEFYNSLSDEQKARFNAVEQTPEADNPRVARDEQNDVTRTCSAGSGVTDVPIQRISQAVQPTGAQRDALNALKDATSEASAALKANCPSYKALTPVGRVELMEQRLKTLLQAAKTVQPALAGFYNSLNDEQKERFNRLGARQS